MSEKLSESSSSHNNEYFDPAYQPTPDEIFGVPTEPLLNLSKVAGDIALLGSNSKSVLPPRLALIAFRGSASADKALSLFPLVERIQAGETITPEDVRPYRKSIKGMLPKIRFADRLAKLSSVVFIGIPIRRALNRKIEKEFPKRVASLLDRADEYLPQAEPYFDYLSSFDNPREQFVSEIALITDDIQANTRKHARRNEVTAIDAGYGISKTIDSILSNENSPEKRLPMVTHLLVEQLSKRPKLPSAEMIGVVAPEIVKALYAALPKEKRDQDFLADITYKHPHPKRGLAETFKGTDMRAADRIAKTLLPSIRDLLPTRGADVKATYTRIKDFLSKKR